MLRLTPLLISLSILTGCAITESGCREGDWASIGKQDGLKGYSTDRIEVYNKACSKVDITPDFTLWNEARKEGLIQYCTPLNAFLNGKNGVGLKPNCPANIQLAMNSAHDNGQNLYRIESRIRRLQSKRNNILSDYKNEISETPELQLKVIHMKLEIDRLRLQYRSLERQYLSEI